METVPASEYPAQHWAFSGRPRYPYAFETITLRQDSYPTDKPGDIDLTSTERRYLKGPIHPELLALEAGNVDSFLDFVGRLGIHEFGFWLSERFGTDHPEAWKPIIGAYEVLGLRHLSIPALAAAWSDPLTVRTFSGDQSNLRTAFEIAHDNHDPLTAASDVLEWSKGFNVLRMKIRLIEESGRLRAVEAPVDIFARGWFELLDALEERGLLPKTCAYCGRPFAPTRSKQRYCPGSNHQKLGAEKRRSKDPSRREYQKLRRRLQRATNPHDEQAARLALDAWAAERTSKED